MNIREDLTLSVRAMFSSPLESLLLVIGLALSIGATSSGFGMFEKAMREGENMLAQAEYREIVVTTRESADEMAVPVVLNEAATEIQLSIDDLGASAISPDISFAYLASRTRVRFNNGTNPFGPPPEEGTANNETHSGNATGADSTGTASTATQDTNAAGSPDDSTATNADAEKPQTEAIADDPHFDFEMASVEGPVPVLNEVPGYQVTPEFFTAMNMDVKAGSVFTEQDMKQGSLLMVVGSEIARTLFDDGIVMDRQVASFVNIYTIIGVLKETGTGYDGMVFIPSQLASDSTGAQAARGPFGGFNATLHFAVDDASRLESAADQLESWFNAEYGSGMTNISVPREVAEAVIDRNEKVAIITMVLALAGLLIASVNVSNILYSRTLRRRKQIGILKALGASQRDIFTLFFNEGGLLLAIGALFGLVIVFVFSLLIANGTGDANLSVFAIVLGLLVSSLITLAFTLVPALQAAKIPPAEAIRVE